MKRGPFVFVLGALFLLIYTGARAQMPRVTTLYPIGGKAGTILSG